MRIKFNFEALSNGLEYVTTIVEDKLLDEAMRNIIFKVTPDKVVLVGYNSLVTCHTDVDAEEIEEVSGETSYMQIKAKELNDFFSTLRSLRRTKVTDVEFRVDKTKVILTVHEEPSSDDLDYSNKLSQTSTWLFDNVPIKEVVMREINISIDRESTESITSVDVLLYLNSLLPLVADDAQSALPSRLHFSDEYVFVIPRMFATLFENQLPSAFKGVVFSYSALGFLKKLLDRNPIVYVGKTDTHISIATDTSMAVLKYQNKIPDTRLYVESFDKSTGFTIDRVYFKDVLKRFNLVKESINIEVCVDDATMTVSNSKFKQTVPLIRTKGMTDNLKFKVPPEVLSSAIIGDDNLFSSEIFIYTRQLQNGVGLVVTDSSSQWKSFLQAR